MQHSAIFTLKRTGGHEFVYQTHTFRYMGSLSTIGADIRHFRLIMPCILF